MNIVKKILLPATTIALAIASMSASAHERFMVPSHTLLSGDAPQYVTLISSISNAIFHPDRPFGDNGKGVDVGDLKQLFKLLRPQLITPQGKQTNDVQWQAFQRMSVADVLVADSGTYRISLVQPDVAMTTFKKSNGAAWRLFGPNPSIPEGATDIVRRTTSSRVETFVTVNNTNTAAIKPTGMGLELTGETHPNDLFAGETAQFGLLFNGKALELPAEVKVIKAGTRHRNNRNEQKLEVNENGKFEFMPKEAGFYFLAAELAQKVPQPAKVDVKHYALYLTLEVFPE